MRGLRRHHDFYPTPPEATHALLNEVDFPKEIWEPAGGDGAICRVLEERGYIVSGSDIRTEDVWEDGIGGVDFLSPDFELDGLFAFGGAIITKPPFKLAVPFIEVALSYTPMVALLLKANFWNFWMIDGRGRRRGPSEQSGTHGAGNVPRRRGGIGGFHLERGLRLHTQSKYDKWAVNEIDAHGQQIGHDQIPWGHSLTFTATSCGLYDSFDIKSQFQMEETTPAPPDIVQSQAIRAGLRPGPPRDDGNRKTTFSMFGTDRAIKTFQLDIHPIADPAEQERCSAWGCVSYAEEDYEFRDCPRGASSGGGGPAAVANAGIAETGCVVRRMPSGTDLHRDIVEALGQSGRP